MSEASSAPRVVLRREGVESKSGAAPPVDSRCPLLAIAATAVVGVVVEIVDPASGRLLPGFDTAEVAPNGSSIAVTPDT